METIERLGDTVETMDLNENKDIDKLEFFVFFAGDTEAIEMLRDDLREIEFPLKYSQIGPMLMRFMPPPDDEDYVDEEDEDFGEVASSPPVDEGSCSAPPQVGD